MVGNKEKPAVMEHIFTARPIKVEATYVNKKLIKNSNLEYHRRRKTEQSSKFVK
jgi:hypothetical protein